MPVPFSRSQELRVGDDVRLMQPGWATVEAVEDTGRLERVYNLEIEDDHTYFVGCDEWGFAVWVHNAACANYDEFLGRYSRQLRRFGEEKKLKLWEHYQKGASGGTPVLGRQAATEAWAGKKGYQILDLPDRTWHRQINRFWLQGAIDAERRIKLVSNPFARASVNRIDQVTGDVTGRSIFWAEKQQLLRAGYKLPVWGAKTKTAFAVPKSA